ncbi:uncharacterized protein LOC128987505 [Macrosteles quadrilineatus]|uniref:uncharacterized protein LOC128987505 n=1 Tax=Macrosteles quadrilineatus TaxID=74068 RepID=UPI0023E2752E|nr:uncharacterized protein LOC128987505 [Macrosteles quadrilineatus]
MLKGDTCAPYKPLTARRRHACNMKVLLACVFGVLVLTGITGHLFSRREVTTNPPPSLNPHHEALAKLIRTSEDAIGWISNKTIDSINNIKNLTAAAVTPESLLVVKKNAILNWLRGVSSYNSSVVAEGAESHGTEDVEDSGESVVIAHRTPGHGFSWGPPKNTKTNEDVQPGGLLHAAGRRVHRIFSYLYHASRNVTRRGRAFIQAGIDKVKPVKQQSSKYSENIDNTKGTPMVVEHWVCAVDWGMDVFTMAFQNGGQAKVYNKEHGTNFSVHGSDVCFTLLARHPEKYQKIDNPSL